MQLGTRLQAWLAAAVVCVAACLTLWGAAQTQDHGNTTTAAALQLAVARAMKGKAGAAVVLDVTSSKVLAAYHPEVAARRVPLPGSAIKPFTLLALLESGKVNEQTALLCKRPLNIGGHELDCTHPNIKQPLDPEMALAYSCNSFFTNVATRLTPTELRESFLKDGFGLPSGLDPDETSGSVALASTQAELQLEAIGEWGLQVTPLELLRAYQRLAQLSQQHNANLTPLFAGLEGSVSYGMGHLAQPDAKMKVAGKTGTALVEEGAWRHGWFAGYAPANRPEIALVVFLEQGHGPTDAAGVAREIFAAYARSRGAGR